MGNIRHRKEKNVKGAASKRSKAQNASCTGPLWDRTFAAEFFSHIAKMARHLESFCPVFLRMFPFWYGNSCTFTQGSFPSHRFSRNLFVFYVTRKVGVYSVLRFFFPLTTKLGMRGIRSKTCFFSKPKGARSEARTHSEA